MKKKTIKEAGNYGNLSQGEKMMLQSMQDPNIRNAIANVVSQFRSKGKNIDPIVAAQQIMQIPHFQTDPQAMQMIQGFIKQNQNLAGLAQIKQQSQPDPFGLKKKQSIPLPPQLVQQQTKIAQTAPMQKGPLPSDQFNMLRNSKTTNNDMELGRSVAAPHGELPDEDPNDPYEQQRLRALHAGRPGNQTAAQTSTIPAKGARKKMPDVNPLAKTIMAKKKQVNEISNPMLTGAIQNVMNTINKLRPEELMAVADLVNNLMKQEGTGMTVSTTTTESKKIVTEVLRKKIQEQINARNVAEKLLSEGPMGNIWDKIKTAGSSFGKQMGLAGQMGQQAQNVGVDENTKKVSQELTKVLGKINQFRSKFNSSTLKNAEMMNGYHDLVLNAVQMYQQYQHLLGPFGQQLVRQIHDAVGNLVYDLNSEKEHIDAFLKQLQQAGMAKANVKSVGGSAMIKGPTDGTIDTNALGKQAQKRADASRVEENPGGSASLKRFMPAGGAAMGNQMQKNIAMSKFNSGDTEGSMRDLMKLFTQQVNEKNKSKKKNSGKKK